MFIVPPDAVIRLCDGREKLARDVQVGDTVFGGDGCHRQVVKSVTVRDSFEFFAYLVDGWFDVGFFYFAQEAVVLPKIKFDAPDFFRVDFTGFIKKSRQITDDTIYLHVSGQMNRYVVSDYYLGYALGAYLSVGTMLTGTSKTGIVFFQINEGYYEYIPKIIEAFYRSFGVHLRQREFRLRTKQLVCYSVPITRFLKQFGVGHERHLPHHLFVSNPDYLKGLYEGLTELGGNRPDTRLLRLQKPFSPALARLSHFLGMALHGPRRATLKISPKTKTYNQITYLKVPGTEHILVDGIPHMCYDSTREKSRAARLARR